jgi:ComF family protein
MLKFKGRTGAAGALGRLAFAALPEYIGAHDLLVPVPLSRKRMVERGYNQSLLICRALSRAGGPAAAVRTLSRKGNSPPQSSLEIVESRLANMNDRFEVRRARRNRIKGRKILLVDDVLTSGATASACARALTGGGADEVNLFTLARTVLWSRTG